MNLRFHFQCEVTEGFLNMDKDILKTMRKKKKCLWRGKGSNGCIL